MEILGFDIPMLWIFILIAIPVTFFLLFLLLSKLIGGMGTAMLFGGIMKFVGFILKIAFGAVAWITRKVIFKTKDYASDQDNENTIWNVQAVFYLILSLIFLAATPNTLLSVYEYKSEGWLFLAILGLFSFFTAPKISNAPIFKKYKFTKEWGTPITFFITSLTTSSAIVHLLFHFMYSSQPSFTLFASLLVYLGFIGFITYKLVNDQGSSTLTRLENAMKKAMKPKEIEEEQQNENEGKDSPVNPPLDEKIPDFQIALSKPTKGKVKSIPITLPETSRKQHMQIIGPTGTGKSILGLNLATQDILNPKVGLIALEPTEDFVVSLRAVSKNINRKYYFVDPTVPNTEVLNPLDGKNINEVAEINVGAFIGYLGKNANEFYKNKQKNALRMAIKVAKVIKEDEATYDDLLDILRPSAGELRKKYANQIEDSRIRKDLEDYNLEFSDPKMFNNAIQNYNGLLDYLKELTANDYMRKVLCGKSTVNLKEVFDKGDILLISTAYAALNELGFVLGRLFITMLQSEIFARARIPQKERDQLPSMAIYIDEVQNYVSEPFGKIFEMARKCNVMMHILHQGLSQLRDISEKLEKSIFDNARQKVIFGGTDIEDCKMFAERIGEEYQKVQSTSSAVFNPLQVTVSSSEQLRFKMTPSQIFNLPGFQTDTLEPAEVLLLLVIHNRIQPEQIGLVSPLPRTVFKEIIKEEDELLSSETDIEEQVNNENQENDIIITNNNLEEKDSNDETTEYNEDGTVTEFKHKRRKRGKRKKNSSVPQEESITDETISTTIDIDDDKIEGDNFEDILLELTDSK